MMSRKRDGRKISDVVAKPSRRGVAFRVAVLSLVDACKTLQAQRLKRRDARAISTLGDPSTGGTPVVPHRHILFHVAVGQARPWGRFWSLDNSPSPNSEVAHFWAKSPRASRLFIHRGLSRLAGVVE